jgi:hypothetical protein
VVTVLLPADRRFFVDLNLADPHTSARTTSQSLRTTGLSHTNELLGIEATIEQAWCSVEGDAAKTWLMGSRQVLSGVITRVSLQGAFEGDCANEPGSAISSLSNVHVHPDHQIDIVLTRSATSQGVLPVTIRHGTRHVAGVIVLDDISRFTSRRTAILTLAHRPERMARRDGYCSRSAALAVR